MFIHSPLVYRVLRRANGKDLAEYANARVPHSLGERPVCTIVAEKVVVCHILSMVLRERGKLRVESQSG